MPNPIDALKGAKSIIDVPQYSGLTPRERHERGDDVGGTFYPLRDQNTVNADSENAVAREAFGVGNDVQIPSEHPDGYQHHPMGPYQQVPVYPTTPSRPSPYDWSGQSLYGLQKAASIGADPMAEAQTAAMQNVKYGSAPTPTDFVKTLTGLGKLAVPALRRAIPTAETLGEMAPEFTPVGGEELYNVAKGGVQKAGDAAAEAYHSLMGKLGGLGR